MNRVVKMRHYGVVVIACGVALIVARPLSAASSCFLLAIIVSSLFGGRGPGLLAVGLSATAFNLFFLPSPLPLSRDPSYYLRFGRLSRRCDHGHPTDRSQEAYRGDLATHAGATLAGNTDRNGGRTCSVHCT